MYSTGRKRGVEVKIAKGEHGYFTTEHDYKFGEQITLDGQILVPLKKGKWSFVPFQGIAYRCSICSELVNTVYRFCPNCGAEMEGEE